MNGIPKYTNWTWLFILTAATILLIKNFVNSTHGRPVLPSGRTKLRPRPWVLIQPYISVVLQYVHFCRGAGALYAHYFSRFSPTLLTS